MQLQTDANSIKNLQWAPPQGTGHCRGSYTIPSAQLNGVIAANSNDDGSLSRLNMTYQNNMACQWVFRGPPGYVSVVDFAFIDTECGWDFVFVFDGTVTATNLVGQFCGNRSAVFGYSDVFVSSLNNFVIQFKSDGAVTRRGFLAVFNFVPANEVCKENSDCNGGGSCVKGTCDCDEFHSGPFCQQSRFNRTRFVPRELHSAVYDSTRDLMIITAGHTLNSYSEMLNDILIYNFTSLKWTFRQPERGTLAPAERFAHTTFMMNTTMYLYGGVTTAEDSDMLWTYNIDSNKWNVIQTTGEYPPMFEGAAYVFVNTPKKPRLYVYGGYIPLAQSFELSRMLFVLDLNTFAWKILPNSPFPSWGPTGVYHNATNSLFFTGGYRFAESPFQPTLQFQIDANIWYNGPPQPFEQSMSYAQSFPSPLNSDTMVIWGGYPTTLTSTSDNNIPCFSQQFQFYDLSCQTWSYVDVPSSLFVRRKGHSLIVRGNQVVVFGGMNGVFLNDMVTLDIPSVTGPSDQLRDECRAKNWCKNSFYWCQDCISRPYCSWCGDSCAFKDATSSQCPSSLKNSTSSLSKCSAAVSSISVNQTVSSLLIGTGDSKDYQFTCDYPTYDILISLTTATSPYAPLNISMLSVRPSSIYSNESNSPYIFIPATDRNRYSGPYTLRISNPNQSIDGPITFSLTVLLTPSPVFSSLVGSGVGGGGSGNGGGGGGGGGGGFIPNLKPGFDENSIMTITGLSLLLTSLILYLIHRTRENVARLRRNLASSETQPLPKLPPPFYKVEMSVPEEVVQQIMKKRGVARSSVVGGAAGGAAAGAGRGVVHSESAESVTSVRRITGRSTRILASARLNIQETGNLRRPVPLSIEPVINIASSAEISQGTKAVCINKLIILPGATALIAKGHVPPVVIGSTPCIFIPNSSSIANKKKQWFRK
ncbi:hypothetical protein BDR26DRAFT_930849 [Obelidium mucronatum]|nr:hypothetical protein BDR26DRAFT_930849 [Obelidium mucronatum]